METRIVLRSGDRGALEDVVNEIKADARRKGIQLAGPHAESPTMHAIPMYKRLDGETGATFGNWEYTVYTRRFEVAGHDADVRALLNREFPDAVHVDVTFD